MSDTRAKKTHVVTEVARQLRPTDDLVLALCDDLDEARAAADDAVRTRPERDYKLLALGYHGALLSLASSDCIRCAPIANDHLIAVAEEYGKARLAGSAQGESAP